MSSRSTALACALPDPLRDRAMAMQLRRWEEAGRASA
jgi:hypothetical protein